MHKVVLWAECGSAALTLNLGRYCGARSPFFFWKCLSFCLVLLVRAPFPIAFPQPEVRSQFPQSSDELSYGVPVIFSPRPNFWRQKLCQLRWQGREQSVFTSGRYPLNNTHGVSSHVLRRRRLRSQNTTQLLSPDPTSSTALTFLRVKQRHQSNPPLSLLTNNLQQPT